MSEPSRARVRAFQKEVPEETLKEDLEYYKKKALEFGASGAEIVPASLVTVDERVRLRCFVPRCPRMGETPNCPPYTPELEFVKKALSKYSWAMLIKTDVEPIEDYIPKKGQRKTLAFHAKSAQIVTEIERLAFNDGYHLALGFGGGSCKDYLCNGMVCQFLDSGKCRFPLKARPAMEGMGIDVSELINKVGWQIYPLAYSEENPSSIPSAISVGIVFIY